MRRTIKVVTMIVALLALTAGVALAATVDCSTDPSRACYGTSGDDTITGTEIRDEIDAFGGVDTVAGKGGNDAIYGGDGNDLRLSGDKGDDAVYGGPGSEVFIYGREGSDLLVGNLGRDNIFTSEFPNINPGVDTVRAGPDNDGIDAEDGFKDFIDCGTGDSDLVYFDRGLDAVASNCERQRPR